MSLGFRRMWQGRIFKAATAMLSNVVMWVLIPSLLFSLLGGYASSSSVPFDLSMVYAFGAVITGLAALAALTGGMAISVPFKTGAYLAEAFYIWAFLDGGVLHVSAAGMSLTLSFQALVFLMVLPSLFGAIRAPLQYLMEESEAVKPASDLV